MNTTVTARVPVEVKSHVDARLQEIGSTTTQLINAAYDYVLSTGELPSARKEKPVVEGGVKSLSPERAEEVRSLWKKRAVLSPETYDGENFRELLDTARDEYYARFA